MKAMFDLNVVLDVLQNREPYYIASAQCINKVIAGSVGGWIPAHAVTTLNYVLRRFAERRTALEAVEWLLRIFEIGPCDKEVLTLASKSGMTDFEDDVVVYCALKASCDCIVTRNTPDFAGAPLRAVTPAEFLSMK